MPTGYLAFVDTSNNSLLEIAELTGDTVSLTASALAPGDRSIVAYFVPANGSFQSSNSDAVDVSVGAVSNDVAYQVDPSHNGSQQTGTLNAVSLVKQWSDTLGTQGLGGMIEAGDVSYPVIAGGRIFVTVENSSSYGTELYALDAGTGATDWSTSIPGTYGFSALTYDGQTIFALNYNGVLTAYAAATGQEIWSTQMPDDSAFTAPPTAYDGVVYVSGAGSGGLLYAVSEANGTVLWGQSVANGDKSSPAVNDSGVYVSYACQEDYGFSFDGELNWNYSTSCEGGGGSTPVLYNSNVYARGQTAIDSPVILSESTGTLLGSFASKTTPAFYSNEMFTNDGGYLVAVSPSGSADLWSFGDGTLVTAPVEIGGVVYVGSSDGTVYGVSAATGVEEWSGSAGTSILGPDEQNADVLTGMGVVDGLLVVPAANELTVFSG